MNEVRMQRGVAAEELAAQYLQVRGLKILARNLRCKVGELDLVCLDDGVLAIVEVRQRGSVEFGGASASVTSAKQRKNHSRRSIFSAASEALEKFPHAVRRAGDRRIAARRASCRLGQGRFSRRLMRSI